MEDFPTDLASLVSTPFRIVDDAGILEYSSRRPSTYHGPAIYPTPKGSEFIDHPAPYRDFLPQVVFNGERGICSIDFLRLTFQPDKVEQFRSDLYPPDWIPVRSTSAVAFNTWRKEIVMDPGCERFGWGICEAPATNTVILLILLGWKDPSAQAAGQHLTTTLPVEVSCLLAEEPSIFHFPIVTRQHGRMSNPSHLEAVLFYGQAGNNDRERFEHYYWHFASTLQPGHAGENFASAGTACGGGWSSQAYEADSQSADVYIGLLYWENDEARRQWYEDYSRMSFDNLGWQVEGLRAMAPLGATSHCLRLGDFTRGLFEMWECSGVPFLVGGDMCGLRSSGGFLLPGDVL